MTPNGWRLSGARMRVRCSRGVGDRLALARRDRAGVAAWMRRVSPGSHNRSALDGDDFTRHSPLRVSPNGLRAPAFIFPAQV